MTTEQTVFTTSTEVPVIPPVVVSPTTTILPQEVLELVGTGKKYATADAALASIPHAQRHIATLEAEALQLKEELAKRKTTEQLLEEIKQNGLSQGTTTPSTGITQETVTQLVTQTLENRDAQQRAQDNINIVTSVFKEKFLDKAEEMYIKVAKESGLTIKDINRLAETSPGVILKLAGLEQKQNTTPVTKITSSVNTETLKPTDPNAPLSARVARGGSTKDLLNAWKIAGQKVGKQL